MAMEKYYGKNHEMDAKNDRMICSRYASVFIGQVSLKSNLFGFECGDGWLGILEGTLSLIQKNSERSEVRVNIRQIKEKFGQLRIYYRGGDEITRVVVEIAEIVSGGICELCGRQGESQSILGWLQTRCAEHSINASSSQSESYNSSSYSLEYSEAVGAICSMFKTTSAAWVKSPALAFGTRRPYELLNSIDGCKDVIRLIKRLEYGVSI